MQKSIAVKKHLNIINRMIKARNQEVSRILSLNAPYAVNSRIGSLKRRYLSMLDTELFKKNGSVKKTGEIPMGRYRIEKLVLESLKGYFVPMNLYISDEISHGKRPAVLVNVGHYLEGKALPEVQITCANLALQGFVALTFDPVCQGERDLFPDCFSERWKKDMWVVEQHMRIGNQCFLLGYNSINYFLNDAIKAVDYLSSREDVDAGAIGATGQSGGGTLTYLLAALDSRIKAAVPVHCISTMDRICANGIGDSEQSMINMISEGFDIADFLWLIAPRPLFISAGTRDFFSIDGVKEVSAELKRLYKILGYENNVDLCEIDTGHVIDSDVRKSIYDFLGRVFTGNTAHREEKADVLSKEQLSCGYAVLNSRTPIDYNQRMYDGIKQQTGHKILKEDEIKAGLSDMLNLKKPVYNMEREDICIKEGKQCRNLLFSKDGLCFEADMKLEGEQKSIRVMVDMEASLCIGDDAVMKDPANVLVIRPFGSSNTLSKGKTGYDDETRLAYQGFVTGENILGIRLSQIFYLIDLIKNKGFHGEIVFEGKRQGALLALFAGVFDDRIAKVYCTELIDSFGKLVGCKDYGINETDILPGFLKILDVDRLVEMLGDKVFIC